MSCKNTVREFGESHLIHSRHLPLRAGRPPPFSKVARSSGVRNSVITNGYLVLGPYRILATTLATQRLPHTHGRSPTCALGGLPSTQHQSLRL